MSARRGRGAFTLLEVLVVLTILAIGATLLVVVAGPAVRKALQEPASGGSTSASKTAAVAEKVVVATAKKLLKVVSLVLDLQELVIDILAIIDGREVEIKEHLTPEQAHSLRNGGMLFIRGADGKEFMIGAGGR